MFLPPGRSLVSAAVEQPPQDGEALLGSQEPPLGTHRLVPRRHQPGGEAVGCRIAQAEAEPEIGGELVGGFGADVPLPAPRRKMPQ
jgi:hypothetical protein